MPQFRYGMVLVVLAGALRLCAAENAPPKSNRLIHPGVSNVEIWPGPDGYPWAASGIRVWTREALLKRVGPGELLSTWTCGGFSEPVPGNFTMIARSTDDGKTWTHAGKFAHPTRGVFTTDLFVPRPGEVHAFLQTYGFGVWMTQLLSYRAISKDGGLTWNGPHSIPGGIPNVWPGRGLLLASGRWMIPVAWPELTGEEWAEPSEGRAPMQGQVGTRMLKQIELPVGADSPLRYRTGNEWCDRNHRFVCGAILSDDNGETFRLRGYIRGGAHDRLIEPRVVELSDGRIAMLIRSQGDNCLWRSDSPDKGETWGPCAATEIPNPASKVLVLRAKDGRIFLVHNPNPAKRNPLSLWISGDDMKTWSVKVDLVKDTVSLNYPDGFLDEDKGELVFTWEDARSVYLMRVSMNIR